MFNKSTLNDIRDRISIVALIGERVPLKRAGRNFKGRCPFHNEKTPSFNVSDEKGIYHCFGCGEGGDIFQFVMKFDGLSFSDSVRFLAGRAGVALPAYDDPAQRAREDENARKKRWCLRINEIARDYFAGRLLDEAAGAGARKYLQARGIPNEFWTQLFLGYADNSWDGLLFHFKEKDVPLELASEIGLLKKKEGGGGYYDFFRNRVIFPIVSPRGEILGFGGRNIGDGQDAKYLNSPDSVLYHKSNCVYGLDKAKDAIRNLNAVIIVEGYMDRIALHQAGIENVVAPLGTALTAGHVKLLSRYTRNFTVVFDGDEAGSRAALKSLEIFMAEGLSPRVVQIPVGFDPDTLVRKEGAEGFKKRLENAASLFEYFVEKTIEETGHDASGKVAAMGKIAPVLRLASDRAERGIYRRYVSKRLDCDEGAIEETLVSQKGRGFLNAPNLRAVASRDGGLVIRSAERLIVEAVLSEPKMADVVFGELDPKQFEDEWSRTAAIAIHEYWKENGEVNVGGLLDGLGDSELKAQLRHISLDAPGASSEETRELVRDCVARIKKKPLLAQLERMNSEIRRAEAEGNDEMLIKLLEEKKALAAQVRRNA